LWKLLSFTLGKKTYLSRDNQRGLAVLMLKRRLFEKIRTYAAVRGIWMSQVGSRRAGQDLAGIVSHARVTAPLVRIGPPGDGGYLLPDDFIGVSAVISPGVSDVCDFDLHFAVNGLPVFLSDASIDDLPRKHENFHFTKKYIDIYDSEITITFEKWLSQCAIGEEGGDLILQMDIEGAEYRVLSSIPEKVLKRFRIIILEAHNLEQVYSPIAGDIIMATFLKLTKYFNIVHIHPNNNDPMVTVGNFKTSPTMEFTFYRNDRPYTDEISQTPHPLDSDCVTTKPSVSLSKSWG